MQTDLWDPDFGPRERPLDHPIRKRVKRYVARAMSFGRSPASPSAGIAILAYHGTGRDHSDPWWLDFRGHMNLIEDLGYEVISLDQAIDGIVTGRLPDRPSLAITFDDGFANNMRVAFPELARRGWPSTVFLTTGYLGRRPYLSEDDVPSLPDFGVRVENHTHTHPDLPEISSEQIQNEIEEAGKRIADLTGSSARHFLYPKGKYNRRVRDAVFASGLASACSGRIGFNPVGQDLFVLRRLTLERGDGRKELRARLARGYDYLDRRQRHMDQA